VTNKDENTISMYAVNAVSGQLRSLGYVLSGLYPFSITVDPSGQRAYVANRGVVSVFMIDGATGALTAVGTFAGAAPVDGPVSIITTGMVQ
jgi:DNA-binding beta-propeller fold protein YncE